jgi:hypothetical protein
MVVAVLGVPPATGLLRATPRGRPPARGVATAGRLCATYPGSLGQLRGRHDHVVATRVEPLGCLLGRLLGGEELPDSTKVVGLISLPGAMTGLILAGVDPLTAIRYQIVVMYMLLAATALAALVTARLAEQALFDHAHRLAPLLETPRGAR